MTTASKILIAAVVAIALFLGFVWLFVLPAHSSSPTIRQRNEVDHFTYTDTAFTRSRQVIYGTNGDDVIHGNKLQNGKPAQVIYALAGNDRVWGGKGEDYVYGQKGDDRLHAYHASAGYIYGGPGYDRCTIAVFPGGMTKVHTDSCEKVIEKPAQGHG